MSHDSVTDFFSQWATGVAVKPLCETLYAYMRTLSGVETAFVARPDISYSIRMHQAGAPDKVAALLDVIDDDPEDRWISLCFPAACITDPDEEGDVVPSGLNGEDACCFNIDADSGDVGEYMKARLQEAASAIHTA